ncbi:unnamed protein product [Miscanthus lutarioriparius]|uniref:Uncharacterized protein n=1 Tax=Miscanthus lutarioriparius TaxID=422564 RepID=A0A811S9D6_9POAL|nr:unnamed protein product [Miscanthus lutarioriparius]
MENGGERRAMENGGGTMRRFPATEWVMCSTCSGFVRRRGHRAEVVEVVKEAKKMWDLMKAVLLHGPLQEREPAEATKEQWTVLQKGRMIMMETKKCPTCSGSLLEACPTSSMEEGSEFMAVLPSEGGVERKKIAMEDEAMVADARSEQKLKQSREEGKRSSSGLEEKKAKSEDKEGSGSKKKKAKRSSEMDGSGSKEAKMNGSELKEEAKIEDTIKSDGVDRKTKMEIFRYKKAFKSLIDQPPVKFQWEVESAVGNRKTKMVTQRLDKKSIHIFKNQPPPKPLIDNSLYVNQRMIDIITAHDEVDRVLLEYLQCHSSIKGYAEVQLEVTDGEGDDHKLV